MNRREALVRALTKPRRVHRGSAFPAFLKPTGSTGPASARRADDRGAVAIMVALCTVALFVSAALVVNLGLARTDRVTNKTYTDAAAIAGVMGLYGAETQPKPFAGVCAALAYLRVSDPSLAAPTSSWQTGSGTSIGADPCAPGAPQQSVVCVPDNPSTWASYTGTSYDGRVSVDIKSGYVTPDPDFDPAGSGDNSTSGGCDQLAVIIHQSREPGLAGVVTDKDIVTNIRSVARATGNTKEQQSPALLILERTDCPAIAGGSSHTPVEVQGYGDQPGMIHADSLGNGYACGKVLTGKSFRNIVADPAETGGAPGVITTAALSGLPGANAANAFDSQTNVCAAINDTTCGTVTGRGVVGRGPVDARYLSGVRAAMASAGSTVNGYNMTAATAAANGFTVLGGTKCSNLSNSAPYAGATGTRIYFDCAGGASFKNYTLPNATTVVFNGSVSVGASSSLSMPSAERVYVKGSPSLGFSTMGTARINTGAESDCSQRTDSTVPRAQLVVGSGGLSAGSQASLHLCFTTVVMADGWQGGCPPPTVAISPGPPPATNSCSGSVSVGAGADLDWTAPNQVTGAASQADWSSLEDLALWTETSSQSTIGGNGSVHVTGVFFLPNASVSIGGGGSQNSPLNAQFVARQYTANGGGSLVVRPSPTDTVTIPAPPTFGLVR